MGRTDSIQNGRKANSWGHWRAEAVCLWHPIPLEAGFENPLHELLTENKDQFLFTDFGLKKCNIKSEKE
jgi:hypothetical protein